MVLFSQVVPHAERPLERRDLVLVPLLRRVRLCPLHLLRQGAELLEERRLRAHIEVLSLVQLAGGGDLLLVEGLPVLLLGVLLALDAQRSLVLVRRLLDVRDGDLLTVCSS